MRKDNRTFEEKLQRLHVLSGIKPINEDENRKGTQSTIVESHKIGGLNYVIVKESGFYFIKTSESDVINENTLKYIGGEANRREFKYNSYADALKNLNLMKQVSLQESWSSNIGFSKDFKDVSEDTDMDDSAEAGMAMGMTNDDMKEQLEKDIMGGQDGSQPQGNPAPQGAPAPEAPMPEPQAPAPEPQGQPAPAPEGGSPTPEQDAEFAQGNDGGDQIDHFVGKLTGELRQQTETLDSNRLKGIINSVLSAIDLQKIDPDTRFEIGKRIKDGSNKQEGDDEDSQDAAPEGQSQQSAPAPEPQGGAPEEQPMQEKFNKVDDQKINEFFHNNRKEVIMEGSKLKVKNILVETKGNNVILKKGDKSFSYNVSEKTINKLNQLKEHKSNKLMNEEIANFFKKKI